VGTRRALPIAVWLIAAACTFPPLTTPTPRPTPTPTAPPTPIASPSPVPTASPSPTPGQGSIPRFAAGELVETTIDGMRVRQRPGAAGRVITGLLPARSVLEVVMGPIRTEDFGWYLVSGGDLGFDEGWIAAGHEPDPFLASTGAHADNSPYVASFAETGDAEYGPVPVAETGEYAVRWVAVDPERVRCTFAVLLAAGGGDREPAIRATIGADLVPGTLQPNSFDALGVRGQVFVTVASDCAWTLVVERIPDATPEPSPTG
jgi:hypothetical protein